MKKRAYITHNFLMFVTNKLNFILIHMKLKNKFFNTLNKSYIQLVLNQSSSSPQLFTPALGRLVQFSILLLFVSCSTSKVVTTNLQDLSSFEPEAQIYALPKTSLIFKVTAVKHNFQPGPYHKYAKRFLGIEGAKSVSEVNWEIVDMKQKNIIEPDIDQYYSVKFIGPINPSSELLELSKDGLIISPDKIQSYQGFNADVLDKVEQIHFTDLTISPFTIDEKRKKPKNVLTSSEFDNLPARQKHIEGKTTEEKAFEASKFIFKIRKRRFKLLAGQYEVFPEGTALETSIRELNQLEKEYLSLFIGKVESDTVVRVFTYTPLAGEPLQRVTLFRFSEETGFYTSSENQGTQIILVVKDMEENKLLTQLQLPMASLENVLLYREPDKGSIKVLYGSYELMESVVPVFQFGALIPLYVYPDKALLSRDR
jgi:hypothetical protein